MGAINDDRFLYLTIMATDQLRRRQFATEGLIVWLDGSGKKQQSFGILIPGSRLPGPRPPARSAPQQAVADIPAPVVTYFELLGPKRDDRRRIAISADSPITVAAGSREGTLVYELRIPLARAPDRPDAIGTEPGRTIGFGLETPKVERPAGPEGGPDSAGGRRGGGGGGARGGMGRGGFGGGRGGPGDAGQGPDRSPAKPLKVWTTMELAPLPSTR